MESGTTERSAVGRVAQVGDLYNAYSESFTGISLLKKAPPETAICITDNHSSNIEFVLSDTFADKCEKLNISAELKVSLMAGLIKLGGSGKYLQDEKHSARAVRSSLIYNIHTQVEHINLFADELKDCFALDALNIDQATHVVVEVRWGANSMVTMEYSNEENDNIQEIQGALEAELKKFSIEVKGEANVEFTKTKKGHSKSFSLRTFADILPTGELPQTFEGALEMMKKMPQYLASANNGKGKPLSYLLLPLSALKDYLKVANIADKTLKTIDEEAIIRFVKLFDEITKRKQQLHDLYDDMKKHEVCVTEKDVTSVGKSLTELNASEAQLKSKFAKILIDIRSGTAGAEQLESLRNEFEVGPLSLQYVTHMTSLGCKIKEKIAFIELLSKEGAGFVGRGSSLETLQMEHYDQDIYILFYSDIEKQVDPSRWRDHINLFLSLIKEAKSDAASKEDDQENLTKSPAYFIVVDIDLRPDLQVETAGENIICLCLLRNGKYIDTDVVMAHKENELVGLIRSTHFPEVIDAPPNKRVVLELCCPGSISGTCPNTKLSWYCKNCSELIEYGFDNHFYCKCGGNGRVDMAQCEFRCNNSRHGQNYLPFTSKTLTQFLARMKPMAECMNILILGETGVGKTTWINAIANYMAFATLEEAKENKPVSLIGASFTVTDEEFEEHVITIGDTSNENVNVGQSATQGPKSYVFKWKDTFVRLIDTPGIGDTRGIDQDKANFEAIISFLAGYDELHGICILLKPNNTRLGIMFQFCIKELLTHLHRSCSQNIVFCFTNARSTDYKPGETLPALKKLLSENKNVEISLSKHTVYCMDNESFRYLCLIHNGVPNNNGHLYSTSWDKSVEETNRLLKHIKSLKPHKIHDTVSLNETRRIVVAMTEPMAVITKNIQTNLAVFADKEKELRSSTSSMEDLKEKLNIPCKKVETVPLKRPRTVCTSLRCIEKIKLENTNIEIIKYAKNCHEGCEVMPISTKAGKPNPGLELCAGMCDDTHNCKNCGCSWKEHMVITSKQKQTLGFEMSKEIKKSIESTESVKVKIEVFLKELKNETTELEEEQKCLRSACVQFGSFLANNALLPYNDALADYLDALIKQEEEKVTLSGSKSVLDGLKKMRREYKEEVEALKESMKNSETGSTSLSVPEINQLVEELYNLPKTGEQLRKLTKSKLKTLSQQIRSQDICYKPPPNSTGAFGLI